MSAIPKTVTWTNDKTYQSLSEENGVGSVNPETASPGKMK
jgi:hypothetical protein